MKDRIAHIMRAQNLKASDFAELLGIQPSGISHILSGRNQPSLDFVKKIKETFPEYNLDWIIFGKGPMTTSEPFRDNHTPAVTNPDSSQLDAGPSSQNAQASNWNPDGLGPTAAPFLPVADAEPSTNPPIASSGNSGIKSVFIFYKDGTFETFNPR